MKRLLPARAAARQMTRTAADRWRPPATAAPATAAPARAECLQCAALFSSTARAHEAPAKRAPAHTTQAMPRGAYYDVLITSPPPYSNAMANEPPVTSPMRARRAQTQTQTQTQTETETPKAAQSRSTFTPSEAPAAVHAARLAAQAKEAKEAKEATKEATAARARIVFGSRLAGPMERESRLAEIRKRSKRVAGVVVPPKPAEPDNCCMSGCVNCVWDRFRDEMEAWALATAEVQRRRAAAAAAAADAGGAAPTSMDDDGGGSDTNWSPAVLGGGNGSADGGSWEDEMFKDVPVGIREFMKQEKRLKLKHMQEGTMGG